MTQTSRPDPPLAASETETLLTFLDYFRATVRLKAAGLTREQLNQTLPPSSITLGGLLKHLAYVEDWWIGQVMAGIEESEPWASVDWAADADWDWHSAADDSVEELLGWYDASLATSQRLLAEMVPGGLDQLSVLTSRREPGQRFSLRWVLVHLIGEYARHAGHADLVRESIDGEVGD
ncbi:MAG: DinB family protein [Actinomycetota bacterium]|nr:DinB family protein [Actinomycetota bacterium]